MEPRQKEIENLKFLFDSCAFWQKFNTMSKDQKLFKIWKKQQQLNEKAFLELINEIETQNKIE